MHQRKETAPRRSANVVHGKEPVPGSRCPVQRDAEKSKGYVQELKNIGELPKSTLRTPH